jgi:beta-lactamase superfamily II metal-dependent hydrolase
LVGRGHLAGQYHPPGLAAWCQPELVVISGGGGPAVAGVENTYRSAGDRVLRTDRDGAVQVAIDWDGVSAASWINSNTR